MSIPQLDHPLLFLPHTTLQNLPSSITSNFTVTSGGTHADGKTLNRLIIFPDASYIALFAFLDPSLQSTHWIGDRPPGWFAWYLSTPESGPAQHEALKARLEGEKAAGYEEPEYGGRKGEYGEARWTVTYPRGRENRFPFFVNDVSRREVRVPVCEENISHPCGAVGIKSLDVVVEEAEVAVMGRLYEKVLGVEAEGKGRTWVFRVGRVKGLSGIGTPVVVLRDPEGEVEARKVRERGCFVGNVVVGVAPEAGMSESRIRLDTEEDLGGWYLERVEID